MIGPDSVQGLNKSPKSPKTAQKVESVAVHHLRNIQNVTPSMHYVNVPKCMHVLLCFIKTILQVDIV